MRDFLKFCFVLFLLAKIQKKWDKNKEKVYGTSKIFEFLADKMTTEKNYGNSRISFIDVDIRNISGKLQLSEFSSY